MTQMNLFKKHLQTHIENWLVAAKEALGRGGMTERLRLEDAKNDIWNE